MIQQQFQVISATIEIFYRESQDNIGFRWNKWPKRLNQLFVASATTNTEQKEATLLLLEGINLNELHDIFPEAFKNNQILRICNCNYGSN